LHAYDLFLIEKSQMLVCRVLHLCKVSNLNNTNANDVSDFILLLMSLSIKCYTAVDSTASKKLTNDIVGEIAASSRMRVGYNLTARLVNMVHDYK